MSRPAVIVIALVLSAALLALGDVPLSAQVTPPAGEKIGQVVFPVSCAPAMQKPFERAVALLHSFWYLESAKAFAAIAQADPSCGMAYWGVALSQWTQIWSPPSPPAKCEYVR